MACHAATMVTVGALVATTEGFTPPNILFFLADDIGFSDFGFYGMDLVSGGVSATPTIDGYMADGVILAAVYGGVACSPGRGAFMSGRYPMRYGIQAGAIDQEQKKGIFMNHTLISNDMQKAGYRTLGLGKWHLGCAAEEQMPWNRGFDSYFGFVCMGAMDNLYKMSDGLLDFWKDGDVVLDSSTSTRTSTLWDQHAVRFLRDSATLNRPSFVYYALQDPHSPLAAPAEYLAASPCAGISDSTRQTYCGMLAAIDNSVRTVMEAVELINATHNTVMCFSGDNGGAPNSGGYNWPLRGDKGSLYEGGIRQASWCWASATSGYLAPEVRGTVYHGQLHLADFYPSLLYLATAGHWRNAPGMAALDGVNAWPAIATGGSSPRTETLLNAVYNTGALRVGNFVLLVNEPTAGYSGHPDALYNPTFFNNHFGWVNVSTYTAGEAGGGGGHHDQDDDGTPTLALYNVLDDPYQYHDLAEVLDADGNQAYGALMQSIYTRLQALQAEAVDPDYDSNKYDQAGETASANRYWGPWVQTLDQIVDTDDDGGR